MARMSFLSRRRGEQPAPETEPPAAETAPTSHRRPLPPPTRLRRERRTLLRVREERIRDLGGLVLEMHRRQGLRQDLVDEQGAAPLSLADPLHQLHSPRSGPAHTPRAAPAARR